MAPAAPHSRSPPLPSRRRNPPPPPPAPPPLSLPPRVFQLSVEELDLSGEGYADAEWLAYFGRIPISGGLNLADCKRITDSAIWPLSGMTSLKELNLSRCSKITDAGIRHLLSSTSLEKLYISETTISATGVLLLNSF